MRLITEFASLVEEAIKSLPLPGGALAGLYQPIAYGLDAGGKRLRPVLALLAGTASGATAHEVMPAALAVEMFHNFTLLHDDVMDNSPTRRGKPSVQKQWGVNTAILSGDTLYGLCYNQLLMLPDHALRPALECFNRTAIEVFEGQQYDMDFENREDVSLKEYMEMIRLKTSVLLGGAARLGAIAGGAAPEVQRSWYEYSEALGLAFQIQDDWLDVYGDPTTFGKPIGGDILNAKKTFLLLTALDSPHAEAVRQAMQHTDGRDRIEAIRAIYDELQMTDICHKAITAYTDRALKALETIPLSDEYRSTLRSLALNLASRSK